MRSSDPSSPTRRRPARKLPPGSPRASRGSASGRAGPRSRTGPTAWARAWLGRLVARRIRTRGIDLSRLTFLPENARVLLQRTGTDPVPRLAELRSRGPVHRLDLPLDRTVHLVTGHAETRAVLSDRTAFSNDIRPLLGGGGPASAEDVGGLGFTDPPLHTRLRGLIAPEFTRRRLQRLEPTIEGIVARRLDALATAGPPADLARVVSAAVPLETICGLLGLAAPDQEVLARLGSRRFDATGGAAGAFGAVSDQRRLLFDAVAAQRSAPGPGLIGSIIRAEGEDVSDADLAGLADGILTGGYETTAGMISLGTVVLLREPAWADVVRSGAPDEVERVVEELLRHLSVVQLAFPRFATRDMDLLGTPLRTGDVVLASLSAANRDPAWAGPHPDEVDPARRPVGGHLAFGHGLHRCVGAELARLELRIVLPALFRRFPDLALAVPADRLRYRRFSLVHGVEELPVTF
ncbi:cytochrome P450 [Geodermatophilus sabuli]|uniref:Cytochrome P450 n=1 Tax=Geodermatophilus sabuli TaxID=1564158 RepID=A0A7K3VV05_9ACTN|nr:cytochrome P450 [Geodermatophilus sabuli]NEK56485.1 cytochrome P450 [Geodermatophilus sabuli]